MKSSVTMKKLRTCREDDFVSHLPTELVDNIFSRVQSMVIARCKLVRKSWHNHLSSHSFIDHYVKYTPFTTLVISRWRRDPNIGSCALSFVEISSEDGVVECTRTNFQPTLPGWGNSYKHLSLATSCNGLLGFLVHNYKVIVAYIYNPVSGESIVLPGLRFNNRRDITSHELGYCRSTNTFKVIRLVSHSELINGDRETILNRCDIFSIGVDSRWRPLAFPDKTIFRSAIISFDNVVCWLSEDEDFNTYIAAFDFEEEKFGRVPLPRGMVLLDDQDVQLAVSECRRLCILDYTNDAQFIIWTMEEYGVAKSWTKIVVPQSSFPYDIACLSRCYTVSILRNGNLLFPIGHGKCVLYSPEREEATLVKDVLYDDGFLAYISEFAPLCSIDQPLKKSVRKRKQRLSSS